MSEPSYQAPAPPPPVGPAPKKGLSPLAWVGIGCGALIVIGLIGMAIAIAMGASWVKGKAKEFEENPGMTLARMAIAADPDLELVEADEDAGTITVRNKKTGEEMKATFDEQGKITFESGGETMTMGVEEGEEGEGALTITGSEGQASFRIGAGGEEDIPSWVPRYEDVEVTGTFQSVSNGETSGSFSFETTDSVEEVMDHFAEAFADEGLSETGRNTYQAGGTRGGTLTGEGDGRTVSLLINAEGGKSNVVVTYNEKAGG